MNRLSRFISQMPAGDKVIAGVLATLFVVGSFICLASLARAFQVAIPAYGGTLSEGIVGSPRFANPLLAISDSDRDLVTLTYAGLMGHAGDGSLVPVLAESYIVSSDGTIYTFTLRPNATFSDGTPVTAEDVVFTVQKAQDPAIKSPVYASWANIRAEAIDARTVRFTLPRAYTPFLEDTALGILPKHIWQRVSTEEFPFASYDTLPVGAGPYMASSVTRDGSGAITGYTLTAFDNYALGRPYISKIRFSFFEASAELQAAYEDGDIDSMYGMAKEGVTAVPYTRVIAIFFNEIKNPALEDRGVRRALSRVVDRTTLTQELLGGYATPLTGPLPEGSGVTPLPLPSDEARLSDARTALEEAGYEFDEETKGWIKDGQTLSVTITTSNVPELKAVASQIQKDWAELGVRVELQIQDPSTLTQSVIRPRAYEALLFGEVIGTSPDLYAFWSSSERTDPGLNIANYENAEVDILLAKARTQPDGPERRDTLAQVQKLISDDYPAAFLYTPDFLYDVPAKIQGISLTHVNSPSDRFWGIENWYRYSEYVWPVFVPPSRTGTK